MIAELDQAIEQVKNAPAAQQRIVASVILKALHYNDSLLSEEDQELVRLRLEDPNPRYASKQEAKEFFIKYGTA